MKNNWPIKKLGEVCEVFADGDWIEKKDQSAQGIRLIQTGNIGNGHFLDRNEKARYISESTFKRLRCTEVLPGDCLLSRLPDPVGRAALIPDTKEKMITAVDCTIMRFKKDILPKWFIYYSLSLEYQSEINKAVTGATRQRISRSNLGLVDIPAPPVSDQQRLISFFDGVFEKAAKAKENAQKNLQNARELFESYLQSTFVLSGKGWEQKSLEELGVITSSKRIFKSEYVKDGVPFYRTKEIKELANGKDISLELFISRERYTEIKNKFGIPKEGDVLLSAVGTIGEIYVVQKDDEFYFKDGNIVWLKDFNSVDKYYLKYALQSFVEQIKMLSRGAAYSALTIEKLNKYKIPAPSIKEQRQIVVKLDSLSSEIKKLEKIYQQKLIDLVELKKSVLHKAFNGELAGVCS